MTLAHAICSKEAIGSLGLCLAATRTWDAHLRLPRKRLRQLYPPTIEPGIAQIKVGKLLLCSLHNISLTVHSKTIGYIGYLKLWVMKCSKGLEMLLLEEGAGGFEEAGQCLACGEICVPARGALGANAVGEATDDSVFMSILSWEPHPGFLPVRGAASGYCQPTVSVLENDG
jgi:hypothetical protein